MLVREQFASLHSKSDGNSIGLRTTNKKYPQIMFALRWKWWEMEEDIFQEHSNDEFQQLDQRLLNDVNQ